jgi:hypothetical protein
MRSIARAPYYATWKPANWKPLTGFTLINPPRKIVHPFLQNSNTPTLQHSITPVLQNSNTPIFTAFL